MRLPFELSIFFGATSLWILWDALHRERVAPKRAAMTLAALGGIMIAMTGRFPPLPGQTGLSPLVTLGGIAIVVGMSASIALDVVAALRRRRRRKRADSTS